MSVAVDHALAPLRFPRHRMTRLLAIFLICSCARAPRHYSPPVDKQPPPDWEVDFRAAARQAILKRYDASNL